MHIDAVGLHEAMRDFQINLPRSHMTTNIQISGCEASQASRLKHFEWLSQMKAAAVARREDIAEHLASPAAKAFSQRL